MSHPAPYNALPIQDRPHARRSAVQTANLTKVFARNIIGGGSLQYIPCRRHKLSVSADFQGSQARAQGAGAAPCCSAPPVWTATM